MTLYLERRIVQLNISQIRLGTLWAKMAPTLPLFLEILSFWEYLLLDIIFFLIKWTISSNSPRLTPVSNKSDEYDNFDFKGSGILDFYDCRRGVG